MKGKKLKVTVVIIALIIIILLVKLFANSKANNTIEITAKIIDYNETKEEQQYVVEATDEGESGYVVTLPESINNTYIEKYYIEIKSVGESIETSKNETASVEETTENTTEKEQTIENNTTEDNTDSAEEQGTNIEVQEKLPGDKIYLTEEELENQEITLTVIYGKEIKIEETSEEPQENTTEENKEETKEKNKAKAKALNEPSTMSDEPTRSNILEIADQLAELEVQTRWDGEVGLSFAGGSGTEANPYLIATGNELAYLAQQVNAGTNYNGKYFQLAADIDLDNHAWTPIGDRESTNTFKGIFDGAGHTIANTRITVPNIPGTSRIYTYGFFGSIGTGASTTIIRNVCFNNVDISITASGNLGTTTGSNVRGYHIGIVAGTMYNKSSIQNCIVKNSSITDTNTIQIRRYSCQFAVGGIAGYATNTASSNTDPGNASRYSIDNCFSDVDIELDVTRYAYACAEQFHSGGIIGTIRGQAVWPTNCLYTGTIKTNGFIGPIFGGLISNTAIANNANSFNAYWQGTDISTTLSMSSYYINYTAYNTNFTSTVISGTVSNTTTYRVSTTTSNTIGYVQGVNKGRYLTGGMTAMHTIFNNNVTTGNRYVSWELEEGTFSFKNRLTTSVSNTAAVYTISVNDPYNVGTYTYTWYKNGTVDTSLTSNTYTWSINFQNDEKFIVITSDGTYYAVSEFTIPKVELYIDFDINNSASRVTASLMGRGLAYINEGDFTFKWYKEDVAGDSEELSETSLTLTGLESYMDYKLVATCTTIEGLVLEDSFTFGERIVVYVNSSSGNDNNNGYTDQTPVKTLAKAYSKLDSNGTRNKNIIVVMGNETETGVYNSASSTSYNRPATVMGRYKTTEYNGTIIMGSGAKYLCADTTFQYLKFYGSSSTTGSGQLFLYLQGHSLTMGNGMVMQRYRNASSSYGLVSSSDNAPDFHIVGGYLNSNTTNISSNNNNSTILIKSGTYCRVIAGTRNTNDPSGIMGSYSNPFVTHIIIDISETTNNNTYDVNMIVGGENKGSIYANTTIEVKDGSIGRINGGSLGNSITGSSSDPVNTFCGTATINISGGSVEELYGGSLGRSRSDVYFYGEIEINVTGGIIGTLYGTGAGGVTGYGQNGYSSTDTKKSTMGYQYYNSTNDDSLTKVTINISGGKINSDVYGGGYGYSSYLTSTTTAADGGGLYGDSYIYITGGEILGDVYGAGRGYDRYNNLTRLAQVIGDTYIEISGNPSISGKIYGAGQGSSTMEDTATLIGNSAVVVRTTLAEDIYGGGSLSKLIGTSNVTIHTSQTGTIYGGGNEGILTGTSNVTIKGGTLDTIYGGGIEATVTNTVVNVDGGTTTNVYGGGYSGAVTTTTVNLNEGNVTNVYGGCNSANVGNSSNNNTGSNVNCEGTRIGKVFGGSNNSGTVTKSNVTVLEGIIGYVYGGNNVSGTTIEANVNINGGKIVTVFGGGEEATTTTTNVETTAGKIGSVYGGGDRAGVGTTNVNTNGGSIETVYGGSNISGNVTTTNVTTNNASGSTETGCVDMSVSYSSISSQHQTSDENYNLYPLLVTIAVTFTNQTENPINQWNSYIYVPDSILFSNNTALNIEQNNGYYSFDGTNRNHGYETIAESGGTKTYEFTILAKENFMMLSGIEGEDSEGGDVSSSTNQIKNVFGGNCEGGITNTTNVEINGGNVLNVYGGGDNAESYITNTEIRGTVNNNVYGGGNNAAVSINSGVAESGKTYVYLYNGSNVIGDVYGGGNQGAVEADTSVLVSNGLIEGSVYAGGNGTSAVVRGNAVVTIEGTNTLVKGNVFGGGNQAETGTQEDNDSLSRVNIVGGRIKGNVYGGANTSKVHGYTETYIGYNAVNIQGLTKGNIEIDGTVFGGGEANASGSENYDFSYISVTVGINIVIDGSDHSNFAIKGSIFGSGNASSSGGTSDIIIKNYGTWSLPQSNISLQRSDCVTVINSVFSLSGTTDRTNEYKTTEYSISRITKLKLENNSTLFLNNGVNLLEEFESLYVGSNQVEQKAQVSLTQSSSIVDGEEVEYTTSVTKNVDNRIYMLEGKNLNITPEQNVLSARTWGTVYGMTFFGIYTNANNPSTSTGLYHQSYNNEDTITNAGTFMSNSYVKAKHLISHDITVDGFYTNLNNDGTIRVDYVDVTPPDDSYYQWIVGDAIKAITFEFDLTASKYATLGTYELQLQDPDLTTTNSKFSVYGFASGLKNGISLISSSDIEVIASNGNDANSKFGLTMKSGNSGWMTNGSTSFYTTDDGAISTGTKQYNADNSSASPTLTFCMYHSENITERKSLGDVRIRLQVITPIDDLNDEIKYVDIIINLATALYQNDYYEAAITPGEEYGLFATTDTTITSKSIFSTYYSLFINDFSNSNYYDDYTTYKRVLVSRNASDAAYVYPENTKITMLDMVSNQYYYYVVTASDVSNNKYIYNLSDFTAIGSTDKKFDEATQCATYYNSTQDLIYENYIFHVSFADSSLNSDIINNKLLMEMQDSDNQTLIGVLGIERELMNYTVYTNKDATIEVNGALSKNTIYLGDTTTLNVTTQFTQSEVSSKTVYDTQYFDDKLGIKIGIYNSDDTLLTSSSLLGVYFELDGRNYYPRFDGTTRFCIADKVTDVLAKIKIHTENNDTLATGKYKIKIESFGSSDGIYYGLTASDSVNVILNIIKGSYGLRITTPDSTKIVEKETGNTVDGERTVTSNIEYSSSLENPKITVSLHRRDYTTTYSKNYNLVDIEDYVTDTLTADDNSNEYLVDDNLGNSKNITFTIHLKDGVPLTGTYKLVYKLYDGDEYIGEDYEYIIIK